MNFWLPTRPYGLIDAINRKAVAEYLEKYVVLTPNVDYEGKYVTIARNTPQTDWGVTSLWAPKKDWEAPFPRRLNARGSFEECVLSAKATYDRAAVGATVVVQDVPAERTDWLRSLGFQEHSREIEDAHIRSFTAGVDPLFEQIDTAFMYFRQFGIPALDYISNVKTVQEFQAKISEGLRARRKKLGNQPIENYWPESW